VFITPCIQLSQTFCSRSLTTVNPAANITEQGPEELVDSPPSSSTSFRLRREDASFPFMAWTFAIAVMHTFLNWGLTVLLAMAKHPVRNGVGK
jgi:hypothetical protein